ncbi:two-component sensor histidine kinase [Streptomyces tateyamensis]|uniref:histidine kinase n=1 Tax=Streptomyces tateyamensis TaxID=565073 RepID=A0A2V4NI76_9ACTN|nr:sensor histidine kinase [Streptomyces tateyamensis]PYC68204.1 two-component sensor histidine kinase [Streptomyces tateyamensis]
MPTTVRPPLLRRVPPACWLLLAWYAGQVGANFYRGWQQGVFWWLLTPNDPRQLVFNLGLTAGAAVLLRRHPMPALLFSLVDADYLSDAAGDQVPELAYCAGAIVALHYVAANCRRRTSAGSLVLIALGVSWYNRVHSSPYLVQFHLQNTRVWLLVLLFLVSWLSGNSARQNREHAAELRGQAAAQAVTAERLRIARELHDMVAHSIGIIAIQAGVGARVIERQPAEAASALRVIETTSRETLAGLRRMLGALRQAEPGRSAAPLDPSPGLDGLAELVARTTTAGVRVELRRSGERRPLPAEIELSAYRIVQEALTNVVRHAGTDFCLVELDQRPDELALEIVDEGRGADPDRAGGYGLVGMRERVALLHGSLRAGNRPDGGFQVSARLPLPASTGEESK